MKACIRWSLRAAWKSLLLFTIIFIAGCASTSGALSQKDQSESFWQGRLSIKVHSTPVQAFAADFELQGNAETGTLSFFTPLGSTAARLQWSAAGAQLQTTGDPQDFAEPPTPGWRVDLRELANGRIQAQRLVPEVPVDLKIILQR